MKILRYTKIFHFQNFLSIYFAFLKIACTSNNILLIFMSSFKKCKTNTQKTLIMKKICIIQYFHMKNLLSTIDRNFGHDNTNFEALVFRAEILTLVYQPSSIKSVLISVDFILFSINVYHARNYSQEDDRRQNKDRQTKGSPTKWSVRQ